MTRQSRKRTPATGTTNTSTTATAASQQQPRVVAAATEPKPTPTVAGPPPVTPINGAPKRQSGGKSGKVHDEEQQPAHLGKNKRPDLIGTRPCERYLNGHCNFGKDCWFVHEGEPRVLKPTVPAPQPPASPEPPRPKISLAPTNPWGRVKPPPPDPTTSPTSDPSANRRAVSPVQQHMSTAQHGATPPPPLARPIPPASSSGMATSVGSTSPVVAPAPPNLWDTSPSARGSMTGADPRMQAMPPQTGMVGPGGQMGALGDFVMSGARGPAQGQQPTQPGQPAQTQQQAQQQHAMMLQAQAQARAHAHAQAQAQAQAQAHAAAQKRAQMAHAQAMQAHAQAQARQAQMAQSGGAGGQPTGSGSHDASQSLEDMRRNESMGLGLGGYVQPSGMHLGMARGSMPGESSPPIGPSVNTIGGMRPAQGQYNYGQQQPFGMSSGVLGSSMSIGAAPGQGQALKSPTSQPPMASNGGGVIGQQWGPFGSTGGSVASGLGGVPHGSAFGGFGSIPGGPSPPGGQALGGSQDGLFGINGIADLMANARLGMGPEESSMGRGFPGGAQLWQHDTRSDLPSYQGGLGGVEWQPPKGEADRQPFVMGDAYSLSDTLEDSVPRYQQF